MNPRSGREQGHKLGDKIRNVYIEAISYYKEGSDIMQQTQQVEQNSSQIQQVLAPEAYNFNSDGVTLSIDKSKDKLELAKDMIEIWLKRAQEKNK